MSLMWFIYLASVVPSIGCLLFLLSLVLTLALACTIIHGIVDLGGLMPEFLNKLVLATVVVSALCIAIPSEKTMYKMAAAYGVQTVYESEDAKRIGGELLGVIEDRLDELSTGTNKAKK
jgi:hypothetical protein